MEKKQSNWLALIGISVAGFLGCLDLTIVNTALPAIQMDLNSSVAQLQWVMTILLLSLTSCMVISGKLADLYGRRLCFYFGIILFGLSSLGAGLAPNIHILILFRALQGFSIAFLYTAPIAMIPSLFSEDRHGRSTGFIISANGLGLALGPIVGGFLVSTLGWRWIFFINPPIILLSLILCWNRLPESKDSTAIKKIDWLGFILLLIALPAGILALVQGESWGWFSAATIGLLLIAVVGLLLFYYVERKVSAPIIDFHLMGNRIFLIGLCANFSLALFYAVDFFLIPLYLHYIHGQASYQIGLSLIPATVMVALLSTYTGRIVDKHGPKGVLMTGLSLFIISGILQTQFGVTTSIYFILLAYLIFGIGWACILSPSIVAALSSLPKESAGVAMGTLGTLHNLGGAIGLAIGTLIYTLASKSALLRQLQEKNIPVNTWVNKAVANIDQAVASISEHTHLDLQSSQAIFQHYFLNGYRGAMYLIIATTVVALILLALGLKNKKSNP